MRRCLPALPALAAFSLLPALSVAHRVMFSTNQSQGKAKTMPIKLLSSAGTGFFYTTRKNIRTVPNKLTLRKYDPIVQQHVLFTETKSIKR